MTPYRSWQLARPLADLYSTIEDDLLTNIARRLAKNMEITNTAKWEMQMLAQMGILRKESAKIIAKRTGIASELLHTALEDAAQEAIDELEPACQKAAKIGYATNTRIPPSRSVQSALKAYWKQAKRRQNMVNTVMQYKVKPAWTTLIKGIRGYIDQAVAKQPVYDVLNKHAGAVVIGAETRQQAVRRAIGDLLDKGIPAFVDKAGREWSPEAYINMDIRTTANNVAHQAQFNRMDDYDLDLIEVSSHSGSRPKCAKDQGKLFSRKNKSGTTEDVYGNKIRYYPWKSSSYGEPDGILGINCGHHIDLFVPGLAVKRSEPTEDRAENDRLYQESQQQRAIERKIRRDKQECMMYDALGDKEAFAQSSVRLKRHESELKAFTEKTGRTRRKDREQVIGFGRSQSSKATAAAKKEVEKYTAIHYHKNGSIVVTDDWTGQDHPRLPATFKPNAVVDMVSQNGKQHDRMIYDENGRQKCQISNGPHGNSKRHPFGNSGEHAHDIIWENGHIAARPVRELTEQERKEHSDIL